MFFGGGRMFFGGGRMFFGGRGMFCMNENTHKFFIICGCWIDYAL